MINIKIVVTLEHRTGCDWGRACKKLLGSGKVLFLDLVGSNKSVYLIIIH